MLLKDRLNSINQINDGRAQILAVTKTFSISQIEEGIAAGLTHFGENRIQEAETKIPILRGKYPNLVWHLIGHLQSNKVKKAVQLFDSIDSVDSIGLAEEIDRKARETGKIIPVMIEVNIGGEEQKFGVSPEDVLIVVQEIVELKNLKLTGLMCVAPVVDDPEKVRGHFRRMREIFDEINRQITAVKLEYLSMGMSDDWKVAVEEGANMIRLGRALFGSR